jgi:hypothetical protein
MSLGMEMNVPETRGMSLRRDVNLSSNAGEAA